MAAEAKHEVELISFKNPNDARIFIPKISWTASKEELVEVLRGRVSQHGLIHSIFTDRCKGDNEFWFACIEFYSAISAKQACLFCHNNMVINKQPCAVKRSHRKNATDLPLSLRNCEELANYYLGFNGWQSEILYHRLESEKVADDGLVTMEYCSAVGLSFSCSNKHHVVEGAGIAEATFSGTNLEEKLKAVSTAQKRSRGTALQNAFARVILVVVDGGKKVDVEIDTAKLDPFYYNPIWETYQATVTETDYDCDEKDEPGGEETE